MNKEYIVFFMLCASLTGSAMGAGDAVSSWAGRGAYRVEVEVASDAVTRNYVPFSMELDFGSLLQSLGVPGEFAPWSVQVMWVDEAGAEVVVPNALSEDFAWSTRGTVSWVISRPDEVRYRVYFDVIEQGPFAPPQQIPLIGMGDSFRYNRPGGVDPLQAMEAGVPCLGDLDGDGSVDLVRPTSWSSTWGQPWFSIWFWRNAGTNAEPVYADFVRLYADGKPVDNHYGGCALYDWDGDGRTDVVTSDSVYRNTGKISPMGAPVLTRLCDMPALSVKGEPYRFLIGILDHDGDGVHDAFYMFSSVHYDYEGPPPRNFIKGALWRKINRAAPGVPPVFDAEEPVLRDGELWTEGCVVTGFCDLDRDGDLDLVGNNQPLDRIPSVPQYVFWPNTSAKGNPPVYGNVKLIENGWNTSAYAVLQVENAAYHGLFTQDGYRLKYREYTGHSVPGVIPGYADRGYLMQYNGRCAVQGFSGVDVADWDGDGDWDIISGDEFGWIWLIKNTGSNTNPVFDPAEQVRANGEPIRVMRWQYVQDGNPEYYLGQTKPRYADWDGDGDADIITGNNTNRLVWFENVGTRTQPVFTRSEIIRVEDDALVFAWRCQPAVIDWDGNGLVDLVTLNKEDQLCLFRRYRAEGRLRLGPGIPLTHDLGKPLKTKNPEVCDWDGDGDYDVIGQVGDFGKGGPALFENRGGNETPKFSEPLRLTCQGKEITLSAHEHSFAAVDWYGTGETDLVCGGESGWFYFFRRPALNAPGPVEARLADRVETRP